MATGIPTSNILQPGAIALTASNYQLLSDLQIISPKYWNYFVQRYGAQNYTYFLSTWGGMEEVKGRDYFWFEERGKLQLAVTNLNAVTGPAAGATVSITISTDDVYNSQSPLRVGETVRVASSGVEGKILTVPTTSTATIRPLQSTQAFVSANSANLLAGEILQLVGDTEAGEASIAINPQLALDQKISNSVTQIRDTFESTDLGQMEAVYYDDVDGSAPSGASTSGLNAYTLKGLIYTNRRFLNNVDLNLIKGDVQTNTGLNAGTTGTQGLLPALEERAPAATYTPGSLDISKIHEITRLMKVNGSVMQNQWMQDIFQRQEFNDQLFAQYPAGAFVWGTGSSSEDASVAYGFQNFRIDGFVFQVKEWDIFNTEVLYGKTPTVDQYRNFGVIIPQGETRDTRSALSMKNLTVMYQAPPPGGSIGNGIRVWQHGGGSPNPTNGTMTNSVEMLTYRMLRAAAANQFVTVSGS